MIATPQSIAGRGKNSVKCENCQLPEIASSTYAMLVMKGCSVLQNAHPIQVFMIIDWVIHKGSLKC